MSHETRQQTSGDDFLAENDYPRQRSARRLLSRRGQRRLENAHDRYVTPDYTVMRGFL
ncbi:hypothetical protein ACFQ0K_10815 [Nocardioides caeni]|uniref:hypothetical protein n=1 Tax=Nocardioides caeni TaxID=574700 RepID=UPI0013050DF8|nr:hypothetical protein [Nocardioides caeni]